MSEQAGLDDSKPGRSEPMMVASETQNVLITMNALIRRTTDELDDDPELKRAVLFALIRSFHDENRLS
jgi:hypothetical protein